MRHLLPVSDSTPIAENPNPRPPHAYGTVGILDLLTLLANWGPCPDPCPPSCSADLDGDCTVGIFDLVTLLAHWG